MSGPILVEQVRPHIVVVTLNRPEIANAVDPALAAALDEAVSSIEADDDIRAAIITGAGDRVFCAGADLKTIAAGGRDSLYTASGGFAGFVDAPRRKPWIAAIEGPALAGGLEIALACDLIVASRRARFALPEVKRGMVAAAGGLFRLARRVSPGVALEMIATGDAIDAETALLHGLIDRIAETGRAMEEALALAGRIATAAPVAVKESLGVARAVIAGDVGRWREMSADAARRNALTRDFVEGPHAFLEKRMPEWLGR